MHWGMIHELIFKKNNQIFSLFTKPIQKQGRGKESITISKKRSTFYSLVERGFKIGLLTSWGFSRMISLKRTLNLNYFKVKSSFFFFFMRKTEHSTHKRCRSLCPVYIFFWQNTLTVTIISFYRLFLTRNLRCVQPQNLIKVNLNKFC